MGDPITVRPTQEHREIIKDLVERDKADNTSEAVKNLFDEGARAYGYRAGRNGNTTLKLMSKEFTKLFGYAGMAWLAFFWAFPVGFRLPGVLLIVASAAMLGSYLALDRYEPAVSRRLFGRGESA